MSSPGMNVPAYNLNENYMNARQFGNYGYYQNPMNQMPTNMSLTNNFYGNYNNYGYPANNYGMYYGQNDNNQYMYNQM